MIKKWLILTNYPSERGGLQALTIEICKELLVRGNEIEIWNFRENHFSNLEKKWQDRCKVLSLKGIPTRQFDFKSIKTAYRQLKKSNIDVIFFCIPGTPDFLSYIVAAKAVGIKNIVMHVGAHPTTAIPYSINFLSLLKGFGRWWWRFYLSCWIAMQCITLALFNNENQLQEFVRLFGLHCAKKQLWWPPVDLKRFVPNVDAREKYRRELNVNNSFVFGTVGRLCEQKSIDVIIRAFKKVRSQIDAKLVIVGGGELFDQLNELTNSLKLAEDVIFLGERTDVYLLMNAFDVFVFASSHLNETLGIAILEAMACGIPCIVADIPGPRRVVDNNKYGLLVEPGNVEDLAKKMLDIYSNSDLRDNFKKLVLERAQVCRRELVVDFLLDCLNS